MPIPGADLSRGPATLSVFRAITNDELRYLENLKHETEEETAKRQTEWLKTYYKISNFIMDKAENSFIFPQDSTQARRYYARYHAECEEERKNNIRFERNVVIGISVILSLLYIIF